MATPFDRGCKNSEAAKRVWQRSRDLGPQLSTWRRHLHRYPELSFQEHQTAGYVSEILRKIPGMKVETGVGGTTGVVGHLGGGRVGPHVAIRCDMDALPITEPEGVSFRSTTPGVMHACGHDGHMAILLGTASLLGEIMRESAVMGCVTFIFQPAEETPNSDGKTGASYIVDAGILDDVNIILALHMDPTQPFGTVRLHNGPCMANVDNFEGVIFGHGGHAGYPQLTVDPVWLAAQVLNAIHGIVSRRVSPLDAAAVSVGHLFGGSTNNIIPDYVTLEGTLRSYDESVRKQLIAELEHAFAVVKPLGGHYSLQIIHGEPAVNNSGAVNQIIEEVWRDMTGSKVLRSGPFGMGGEDFGLMTAKVQGALFFVGCAPSGATNLSLHSPQFLLDENALPIGTAIFTETVLRHLAGH